MCIITKGIMVYLVAAPLVTGGPPIPGALHAQENTYVFDDKSICENQISDSHNLVCAPMQLVTCPSEMVRKKHKR